MVANELLDAVRAGVQGFRSLPEGQPFADQGIGLRVDLCHVRRFPTYPEDPNPADLVIAVGVATAAKSGPRQ
ncbi:hypothetical protein GCM10022402_15920 [Salinactinospora qingdaonensis]|uniref:Uncharacterized protein n=1 Tax=Salinactinospora qingdaonensis TaxID=702744 RepID=A0ABP7FFU0_9ACTN